MQRIPDGIGRTVFIALLAGGIFGAFLLVTPQLAATRPSVAAESIIGGAGPTAGDDAAPTTTSPALPTTTSGPIPTSTTTMPATITIEPEPTGAPVTDGWGPMTPERGDDGTVRLTMYKEGPLGGTEFSAIRDLDTVLWRLHVTNTTDQELWGVFAWMERAGRADCEDHHLLAYGETDCWVTTTAYADDTVAQAWVDAWTTTRQVTDMVFYPYQVFEA